MGIYDNGSIYGIRIYNLNDDNLYDVVSYVVKFIFRKIPCLKYYKVDLNCFQVIFT
jgi:hypothetical protein